MLFAKLVLPAVTAVVAPVTYFALPGSVSAQTTESKIEESKGTNKSSLETINKQEAKENIVETTSTPIKNVDKYEGMILSRPTLKNVFKKEGYRPITDYANVYMSRLSGNREVAFKNILFGENRSSRDQIQLFEEGCRTWSEKFTTDSKFKQDSYPWMKDQIKRFCFARG